MSTKRFLLQKILQLFLTLFLVTAITFILMQLSPIDAAEAYSRRIFTVDETRIEAVREQMGLNRPIVVQYLDWLNDLLHFDLGNSYVDNRDVFLIVGSALKETACIVLLSAVLQAVGALILGVLLYLTRKNVIGKILAFASIAAISIPAFYLATSFIDVVAVRWNLISVSGRIRLTRADFSSEEEFLKWKTWSDADYHETEKKGRSFNDNRVALDDYLDVVGAVQSAEDEFFSELLKADVQAEEKALREKRLAALKAILNAKQYRRIWLYYAERKSVTEIARLEGVTKASVSLSLARAIKKISKKFAAGLKNS